MNESLEVASYTADADETALAVGKLARDLNNALLPLMMGLDLLKQPMDDVARNEIIDLLKMSTLRAEQTSRQMVQLADPGASVSPLPLIPTATAAPTPAQIPRARGELVVVIDDEPMILGVVRHILESHGYEVLTAANGDEGCRLYQDHQDRTSVVIVDMFMPELSGHEVIQQLIGLNPDVRIIAISGQSGEMFGPDFLNNNVRGFLHKPFTAYTLLKTMDMLVH